MKISDVEEEFINSPEEEKINRPENLSAADASDIKIITDPEELPELREMWDELAEATETTVFQTFIWNKTWWKYFGDKKPLFIITMYNNGMLTGILPCFIDTVELFGKKMYSCLRLLGSSVNQPDGEDLKGLKPYSDYMDMIVRPGFGEIFASTLIDILTDNFSRFNEIIFEEVSEESAIATYLLPRLDQRKIPYSSKKQSACPVAGLKNTWEEYLKTMSKRRRNHARKFIRNVSDPKVKLFELRRAETKKQVSEIFEKLVDLHQKHWNSIGHPGVFAEKRYHRFLKEATSQLFAEGCVWLNTIYSVENEEKIVAIDLLFVFKDRMYLLQRAYDSSSAVHTNSPGTVLLYNTIRQGIQQNYKYFDFLRGEDSYKYRTANSTVTNRRITISPRDMPTHIHQRIIKRLPLLKRKVRLETDKMKIVMGNEPFFKGVSEYIKFVQRRIQSR
ncbi:MAG: GNAT family N-acetyltransferase [Balneolaceae bacterium]